MPTKTTTKKTTTEANGNGKTNGRDKAAVQVPEIKKNLSDELHELYKEAWQKSYDNHPEYR